MGKLHLKKKNATFVENVGKRVERNAAGQGGTLVSAKYLKTQ